MKLVSQTYGRRLTVLAGGLLLAGCAATADEPTAAGPTPSEVDVALAAIDRGVIQSSLDYLAADDREGRFTGTPGYEDAARYVAEQFAAIGLEAGGTDGWFQSVPMVSSRLNAQGSGITLHSTDGNVELTWGKDFVAYPDLSRPSNRIRAEAVFVGYGVHAPTLGYSDYEDVDVNGKIVVIFSGAPATLPSTERAHYSSGRTKADEMVRRGAIGQIAIANRRGEQSSPWDETATNWGPDPEVTWVGVDGEVADFHSEHEGYASVGPGVAEQLFANAPLTYQQALDSGDDFVPAAAPLGIEVTMYRESDHERMASPNVVGILRGSHPDLSAEYVVYSSHLDGLGVDAPVDGDAIYNGTWDNAIGVAFMLETARALAELPVRPRRSIAFVAVTGEEIGLFGSDYFAQNPTVPTSAIVARVNIDMPLVMFPLDTVTGYGAEHSSLEELMTVEARKEGFEYTPDPYPDEVYFIRSDPYSFVRQGIPSLYLAKGVGSSDPAIDGRAVIDGFTRDHYHAPSDDLASQPVDWETALRFVRASVRIGYRIATDEARPIWNDGDFFGDRFGR